MYIKKKTVVVAVTYKKLSWILRVKNVKAFC